MKTRSKEYKNLKPQVSQIGKPRQPSPEHRQDDKVGSNNRNDLRDKLNVLYTDITSKPSYSAKIADFLRQNDLHGVHRRIVKRTFPRRRVIARFPFDLFMADLMEFPQYKFRNRGYRFALILIDVFTKKLYTAPMKKKTKEETARAFETIFHDFDEFPINLMTDRGLEFYNKEVGKIFDSYGINHYSTPTKTKWKASVAERVIRTIKSRLLKYFKFEKTTNWVDVLPQFTKNYNSTPHSSHGFSPDDVSSENRDIVYKKLYPQNTLTIVCKLKVGDKVRKIKDKTLFEKGYTENWSEEIYQISASRHSNTVCWYKLENLAGEEQDGIWYYYQLNLVARNDYQAGGNGWRYEHKFRSDTYIF